MSEPPTGPDRPPPAGAENPWPESFARVQALTARRTYGIAFTPRSGSTWLRNILQQSRVLGLPAEYFNVNAAWDSISRSGTGNLTAYLAWLKRVKQLEGVFGFNINWPWMQILIDAGHGELLADVDTWFLLRRRDFIAQAVSLDLALQNQSFHRREQDAAHRQALYRGVSIAERALQIMNDEFFWNRHFAATAIRPTGLWYEELTRQSPPELIGLFLDAQGLSAGPETRAAWDAIEPAMRKLADERSADLADRFRKEHADFVAYWTEQRGRVSAARFRRQFPQYSLPAAGPASQP